MRILFAITKGEIGGAQEHVRILVDGMLSRGHQVGVLVETPSDLAAAVTRRGAEVIPWQAIRPQLRPAEDIRARRELAGAVESWYPDVLHLHSSKAGALGRLVRTRAAKIFTCHHASFGAGRRLHHRLVGRPVEQLTLRKLDGIITVGSRDMPMLRKLAPGVPIALIRNAVQFGGAPLSPEPPGHNAIWVARMQHPKDPLQVIRAWEFVIARVRDATLTICGGGPLSDVVHRAITASPAGHAIRHEGQVDDLERFHRNANVYVLASDVEGGTTIATLESMAQGLVPVISDVGDAFLLEHSQCGIVVPRNSPRSLANAVADLFEDEERLRAMRKRALAFVREGWSTEDMVEATERFYVAVRRRRE